MYVSTKRYGHERGFSCAFRQWRANSHCMYLHGYALAFEFVFESETLDSRNWVMDFGDLDPVKAILTHWFDHTTLVAADDPEHHVFSLMADRNLIQMREMPDGVGCERVAEHVYKLVGDWLDNKGQMRVKLRSVQVWEHEGNSARYEA